MVTGVGISSYFCLATDDSYKLGVVRMDHIFSRLVIGICSLKGKFMGRAVRNFVDTVIEDLKGIHPEMEEWDDQTRGSGELAATPPGQ